MPHVGQSTAKSIDLLVKFTRDGKTPLKTLQKKFLTLGER